jgi:protein-S-isoprenylcysteine O-methyltransferase Ste14
LEIPILSVVVVGVMALSVSRILLAIPIAAATYVIIVLAVIVFVLAIVLANRPELKRSVLVGVLVGGGLLLIIGGIIGGIVGGSGHSEEGRIAPGPDSAVTQQWVDTDAATGAAGF